MRNKYSTARPQIEAHNWPQRNALSEILALRKEQRKGLGGSVAEAKRSTEVWTGDISREIEAIQDLPRCSARRAALISLAALALAELESYEYQGVEDLTPVLFP